MITVKVKINCESLGNYSDIRQFEDEKEIKEWLKDNVKYFKKYTIKGRKRENKFIADNIIQVINPCTHSLRTITIEKISL